MDEWVIEYRKQMTADNGDKYVSPWSSFRDEVIYKSKAAAMKACQGIEPQQQDDGLYFPGVARFNDLPR